MNKFLVLSCAAALAGGYALHAWGQQNRIDVRTAALPIASSSSNGVSFAWFYDSSERTVFVCRTTHAAGDAIDCKAKAQLP